MEAVIVYTDGTPYRYPVPRSDEEKDRTFALPLYEIVGRDPKNELSTTDNNTPLGGPLRHLAS